MGTDFSRVRLDELLDYTGVELKQGAVLLDGDANELMDILDRRVRALASDVLGRATVSSTTPDAFEIKPAAGSLTIGIGRLYVDGLLAECHGGDPAVPADQVFDSLLAERKFANPLPYAAQPYPHPLPPPLTVPPPVLPTSGRHLVYLDVWNREVTHLEQPDLVEIAVAVEATSRIQTVWQVRVIEPDAGTTTTCASPDGDLPGWAALIAPSTGVLTTDTYEVAPPTDPCELPPTGGYRGLENQLYRVEIHDRSGAPGGATFKWSRENASVGSRVASIVSGTELELESLGRDDVLSFKTNDWVEIIEDVREFAGKPGEMRKITLVDAARRRITFAPALPADMLPPPGPFPNSAFPKARNLRARRWDQSGVINRADPGGTPPQVPFQDLDAAPPPGILPGVIAVPPATITLILEHGVTVQFEPGANGFRTGDYWVFAARTADASVEKLRRAPPRGIHHHYARLAIWDVGAGTVTDCRHKWPLEGGHDCSCTACVTAESHASGTFTIQAAVDKVKERGGTVCLGPGLYQLTGAVEIDGAVSLRIRGQGLASLIVATAGAFEISNSFFIAIEDLGIFSVGERAAITVDTCIGLSLKKIIAAAVAQRQGDGIAISLQGAVAAATIAENVIFASTGIFANAIGGINPLTGAPTGDFSALFTAALKIDDNIFLCARGAVSLDGNVLHFLGTRITGNEIIGCRDFAVSTMGFGVPASSMTVSRNDFSIAGGGIRCSVEGVWIEGNKLVNSEAQAGAPNAIMLAAGANRGGIDQSHILANQVSAFGGAGILVSTPVRALIVKQNIIEKCSQGILAVPDSKAGKVTIENNQLLEVGPPELPLAIVGGIIATQAASATIAGNTIRSLGVAPAGMSFCMGIYTWSVDRVRVLGNEVIDVGPSNFEGSAVGIWLNSPLTDFEIDHNRVERETVPVQGTGGNWTAVLIGAPFAQGPAPGAGGGAPGGVSAPTTNLPSARAGNLNLMTYNDRRFLAFAPILVPSGSILGNVVKARGGRPAVEVTANDCLFNDNRVEAAAILPAVALSTQVAIVSANRVIGGRPSISVTTVAGKPAAMLGNITTNGVSASPGLTPAFVSLNLTG